MNKSTNLKELERKAYRSTFEDGLFDIFYGCLLILFGTTALIDKIGIPTPLNYIPLGLIVLIIVLGKRLITMPRIGKVNFGPKRKANRKKVIIITISAVIITNLFLLLLITNIISNDDLKNLGNYTMPIMIGVFVSIILCFKAYYLDYTRLYLYAIIIGAGITTAEILYNYVGSPLDGIYAFCFTGGIILIYGIYLLIRFMKKYPKHQY